MSNYVSKWRICAKVVAVIDLLLHVLLLSLFVYFVSAIFSNPIESLTWIQCVSLAVFLLHACFGLWAAVQLLRATKLGRQPGEANKLTQLWENIGYASILLSIFQAFVGIDFSLTILRILVRIIFICIVCWFKREVQSNINAVSPQKV